MHILYMSRFIVLRVGKGGDLKIPIFQITNILESFKYVFMLNFVIFLRIMSLKTF